MKQLISGLLLSAILVSPLLSSAQSYDERARHALANTEEQLRQETVLKARKFNRDISRAVTLATRQLKQSIVEGSISCPYNPLGSAETGQFIDHCEFTTHQNRVCRVSSYTKVSTYKCSEPEVVKGPAMCEDQSELWLVSCYDTQNRQSVSYIDRGLPDTHIVWKLDNSPRCHRGWDRRCH